MTPRLTGQHPIQMVFTDAWGSTADVSVNAGQVTVHTPDQDDPWVQFSPEVLRFLAGLATGTDASGYRRSHVMSECLWADCPEHRCEYTMSHTRAFCGRPTCRES